NGDKGHAAVEMVPDRLLLLDPTHGLLRQRVKSYYRLLEVLLFGVLDLVVRDAMQALHEQHHRRYAGPCDFGCIVQRSAREFMTDTGGLYHGLLGELQQVRVERHGVDAPQVTPGDLDATLSCESFACLLGVCQHGGKAGRVQVPLVEGDIAFSDDRSDDSRLGDAGADRAHTAVAIGNLVDLGTHP